MGCLFVLGLVVLNMTSLDLTGVLQVTPTVDYVVWLLRYRGSVKVIPSAKYCCSSLDTF